MDRDKYQRQSHRYRADRDRRDESILQRIKNDVKAWFEDDDEEDVRPSRSYQDDEYSSYDYQGNEHEGNLQRQRARTRSSGSRSDESGWEPSQYSSNYRSSESRYGTSRSRSGLGSSGQSRWDEDRFGSEGFEDDRSRVGSRDFGASGRESGYQQQRPPYVLYAEYWATSGPYSGVGPKGFRRSASGLKERICERLESAGEIDASDVDVQVENDEVTLTGTVRDRRQKRLAEDCVESVYGVRDIHNQLRVAGKAETGSESEFSSSAGMSGTEFGKGTEIGKSGSDKESSKSGTR